MTSILFVCTGNQFRSPVAAAYLRRLLDEGGFEGWQVASAGTWAITEQPACPEAIRDARALGLDIGDHRTRMVDAKVLGEADLILVMERGQKEALLTEFEECRPRVYLLADLQESASFNIPDPIAYPGEHEKVLREMCEVIGRAFVRIVATAADLELERRSHVGAERK